MKELNAAQLENLKTIANQVKADYPSMSLEDALNRIHFITNRPYDGCIQGLKLMLHHRLIAATFVIGLERLESLAKLIGESMPIITALDTQVMKPGSFESLGQVKQVMSDGPTDDTEDWQEQPLNPMQIVRQEIGQKMAKEIDQDIKTWQANGSPKQPSWISHLNANF